MPSSFGRSHQSSPTALWHSSLAENEAAIARAVANPGRGAICRHDIYPYVICEVPSLFGPINLMHNFRWSMCVASSVYFGFEVYNLQCDHCSAETIHNVYLGPAWIGKDTPVLPIQIPWRILMHIDASLLSTVAVLLTFVTPPHVKITMCKSNSLVAMWVVQYHVCIFVVWSLAFNDAQEDLGAPLVLPNAFLTVPVFQHLGGGS